MSSGELCFFVGGDRLSEAAAIILAAGKSTRMKSEWPKVLHEVCGKPMLGFVLAACRLAGVEQLIVVVGHGKELVQERFVGEEDITWIEQREQKGTGHAVNCCREALQGFGGSVLVIAGDMPLIRRETLAELLQTRERTDDALTLATTIVDDPTGYGRIVRDSSNVLSAIVEHAECTEEQLDINEVNPSYYCFHAPSMFEALDRVTPSGSKGEFYVTDTVRILQEPMGRSCSALILVPAEDAIGINSRLDLAMVNRLMQDRIQVSLMRDGVTIVDPDNTWIEADVCIGRDTTIFPFTYVGCNAQVGESCRLGPFAVVDRGQNVENGTEVRAMQAEVRSIREGVSAS